MFGEGRGNSRRAMAAVLTIAALAAAACTDERLEDDGAGPTTTLPVIPASADRVLDDALTGATTVSVSWAPRETFRVAVVRTDPAATDLAAAAAGYDAVMIAALAAETARSDAPGRIATGLAATTTVGTPCGGFAYCRRHALTEADFDYEGVSGSIGLNLHGVPTQAEFITETVARGGRVTASEPLGGQARGEQPTSSPTDPRLGPSADGVLRIGVALPADPSAPATLRSALAGVHVAVAELNDPTVGGVLGRPVELLGPDPGATDPEALAAAARSWIDQGADLVIGATDRESAKTLLEVCSDAGVPLISPLDPTPESLLDDSKGLYFRTTPTLELSGRVLGQQASYNGVTSPIVVVGTSPIHRAFADAAVAAIIELEGEPATRIELTGGESPADLARMIEAAKPTALVVAAGAIESTALAKELSARDLGPNQIPWFVAPWVLAGR